jgi:hypothetical protein
MTRVLGTIVLLLLIVAAIGYLRGWFTIETTSTPNQSNINVAVDKDAIRQDQAQLHNDAQEAAQKLSPATSSATNP